MGPSLSVNLGRWDFRPLTQASGGLVATPQCQHREDLSVRRDTAKDGQEF